MCDTTNLLAAIFLALLGLAWLALAARQPRSGYDIVWALIGIFIHSVGVGKLMHLVLAS